VSAMLLTVTCSLEPIEGGTSLGGVPRGQATLVSAARQ